MKEHTVLKALIGIIAAVFIFHQLYSAVYMPVSTQSADYYEYTDGLKITGYIIRRESIVTGDADGVFHFAVSDGERVAKGGVIAQIYDSAQASITMNRINELTRQIKDIEELSAYNDLQAADLDLINEKVKDAINELVLSCSAGNFSSVSEKEEELLSSLNRRQVITGEQTDFSAKLNELKNELNSLESSLPAVKGTITAAVSGFFVPNTDGYESVLTCDSLDIVTAEFLDELKPNETAENVVGKIVSDYEWYIAAKVPINDSLKYKEGDAHTVKTSVKSSQELSVTVKQINISSDSDSAVVVFACQQMNSELANMRTGSMTVVNKVYKGLRLAKKSLRVVDEQTGVYVLSGITLKFVPVEVIYSADDYIICTQERSNENVLRLYDEVVVKGKKLYDGKIIS